VRSGLAIEAGPQGWNSLEFKELLHSASEYLGTTAVEKVVIDKSTPYVPQVESVLRNPLISHYLYDPRTGSQNLWVALIDAVRVAILMERYQVVPIVYLTDLSLRVHRCQAAAVSAVSGVVVNFMLPKRIQPIFPHRRIVGPSLMPFSIRTLDYLELLHSSIPSSDATERVVRFTGTLYEPRTTFLHRLKEELSKTNHRLEILGRELGSARVTDDVYWRRLSSAAIVVTTADQISQPGADWTWIPQLVYRYLEVLTSGSLLLAPLVPGVARYFDPDKDFVSYESLEEAVEKAKYYLDHQSEAEAIRKRGHEKAVALIRMHAFWVQIDTALGNESLF